MEQEIVRVGASSSRSWYDGFAGFYDVALDGVYRTHRAQAAAALDLHPGLCVADVGCGTGASFETLSRAVGDGGCILGVDVSPGMLRKARRRAEGKCTSRVKLVDVREGTWSAASIRANHGPIHRVQFFLALSVIDAWQQVLAMWFDALEPGGVMVIADVHAARPSTYGRLVEWVSRGQLTRASWRLLESRAASFELTHPPSSWVLGGQFFVARGVKCDGCGGTRTTRGSVGDSTMAPSRSLVA